MGSYQVTKTPGGGYWVSETDGLGMAMNAAAGVAGMALGSALVAARNAASRVNYRKSEQAWAAILNAQNTEDWPLAYELAKQFTRHYPKERAGYEALVVSAACIKATELPSAERLDVARLGEVRGVDREMVASLRAKAYFASKDMVSLLRESNTLIGFNGEAKAIGYLTRSQALLWLGDLDQALSDANAAVSLMPECTSYAMRADVFWASGDLSRAVADYTRAFQIDSTDATYLERRASVYEAQGQLAAAESDRRAAMELRQRTGSP
jgi:tetratricopeptide (TPR) repeat protein